MAASVWNLLEEIVEFDLESRDEHLVQEPRRDDAQ